jgi:hypothetical protein
VGDDVCVTGQTAWSLGDRNGEWAVSQEDVWGEKGEWSGANNPQQQSKRFYRSVSLTGDTKR